MDVSSNSLVIPSSISLHTGLGSGHGSLDCNNAADGGKSPIFQEKFVFTLIEGLREINVAVWNSNTLSSDDFIGGGKILLHKVISQGYDDSSWPLLTKSGKNAGERHVVGVAGPRDFGGRGGFREPRGAFGVREEDGLSVEGEGEAVDGVVPGGGFLGADEDGVIVVENGDGLDPRKVSVHFGVSSSDEVGVDVEIRVCYEAKVSVFLAVEVKVEGVGHSGEGEGVCGLGEGLGGLGDGEGVCGLGEGVGGLGEGEGVCGLGEGVCGLGDGEGVCGLGEGVGGLGDGVGEGVCGLGEGVGGLGEGVCGLGEGAGGLGEGVCGLGDGGGEGVGGLGVGEGEDDGGFGGLLAFPSDLGGGVESAGGGAGPSTQIGLQDLHSVMQPLGQNLGQTWGRFLHCLISSSVQ
nr:leucine-rich repeat extensin-like protein 6 [Ipomoea batatas]